MTETQTYAPRFKWEMKTGELTTPERRQARAMLYGCFGQKKTFLTGKPIVPQVLHDAYDIHHLVKRGSPGCNLLINLRLELHGPNANAGKPKSTSGIRVRDKDRTPVDATLLLRQTVDYSKGSTEMQANNEAEPVYIAKLWEKLDYGHKSITKKRAIYGLAEVCGVSPQATRDYYEKKVSEDGPFEEFKENGVKRVRVKASKMKELRLD